MDTWWRMCALVVGAGAALLASATGPSPARPVLASEDPRLAELERRAARAPGDAAVLNDLAALYLASGAPGQARAALERASLEVMRSPELLDTKARTLLALGDVPAALTAQREALTRCADVGCSLTLQAHATRRVRLLTELARLNVGDPRRDPARALVAYRRSTREVRLAAR